MPASVEQDDTLFRIRLHGEVGVGEAAALKSLLLEGLVPGRTVQLDLEEAGEIDTTFLQLWQAALREAERVGQVMEVRLSEAAQVAIREAGFAPDSGAAGWGGSCQK